MSGSKTPYFYFFGGEAAIWLDRTVQVPRVSSLTLEQWIAEFKTLKKRNAEILRAPNDKAVARVEK
jgi:hypothetical protein